MFSSLLWGGDDGYSGSDNTAGKEESVTRMEGDKHSEEDPSSGFSEKNRNSNPSSFGEKEEEEKDDNLIVFSDVQGYDDVKTDGSGLSQQGVGGTTHSSSSSSSVVTSSSIDDIVPPPSHLTFNVASPTGGHCNLSTTRRINDAARKQNSSSSDLRALGISPPMSSTKSSTAKPSIVIDTTIKKIAEEQEGNNREQKGQKLDQQFDQQVSKNQNIDEQIMESKGSSNNDKVSTTQYLLDRTQANRNKTSTTVPSKGTGSRLDSSNDVDPFSTASNSNTMDGTINDGTINDGALNVSQESTEKNNESNNSISFSTKFNMASSGTIKKSYSTSSLVPSPYHPSLLRRVRLHHSGSVHHRNLSLSEAKKRLYSLRLQGIILKQGFHWRRLWQHRFVELCGRRLTYYALPSTISPNFLREYCHYLVPPAPPLSTLRYPSPLPYHTDRSGRRTDQSESSMASQKHSGGKYKGKEGGQLMEEEGGGGGGTGRPGDASPQQQKKNDFHSPDKRATIQTKRKKQFGYLSPSTSSSSPALRTFFKQQQSHAVNNRVEQSSNHPQLTHQRGGVGRAGDTEAKRRAEQLVEKKNVPTTTMSVLTGLSVATAERTQMLSTPDRDGDTYPMDSSLNVNLRSNSQTRLPINEQRNMTTLTPNTLVRTLNAQNSNNTPNSIISTISNSNGTHKSIPPASNKTSDDMERLIPSSFDKSSLPSTFHQEESNSTTRNTSRQRSSRRNTPESNIASSHQPPQRSMSPHNDPQKKQIGESLRFMAALHARKAVGTRGWLELGVNTEVEIVDLIFDERGYKTSTVPDVVPTKTITSAQNQQGTTAYIVVIFPNGNPKKRKVPLHWNKEINHHQHQQTQSAAQQQNMSSNQRHHSVTSMGSATTAAVVGAMTPALSSPPKIVRNFSQDQDVLLSSTGSDSATGVGVNISAKDSSAEDAEDPPRRSRSSVSSTNSGDSPWILSFTSKETRLHWTLVLRKSIDLVCRCEGGRPTLAGMGSVHNHYYIP
eukprot:g3636.t1